METSHGQHTLNISSTAGGSVSSPGEGQFQYEHGTSVPITAAAQTNYHFVSWTGTAVDTGKVADPNSASTTVTVDADYTLKANFATTLAVVYVDNDSPGDPGPNDPKISDPCENGTSGHPFDMIQEAIDVAIEGITIVVLEGTYYENINFAGKNITLTSTDPNNPNIVTNTVIDGISINTVVTFINGEDANCVLTGFTITHGNADRGGGIYCYKSCPTISKCLVAGNSADYGGAISNYVGCPTLTNCTIIANWAKYGAGMFNCDSKLKLVPFPVSQFRRVHLF
jgi:hypothetical protein